MASGDPPPLMVKALYDRMVRSYGAVASERTMEQAKSLAAAAHASHFSMPTAALANDIKAEVFFVAKCSKCEEQADLDGGEYGITPVAAYEQVAENGWGFSDDGRIVCENCLHPDDLEDHAS